MKTLYGYYFYLDRDWRIGLLLLACVLIGMQIGAAMQSGRKQYLGWLTSAFAGNAFALIFIGLESLSISHGWKSYGLYLGALVLQDIAALMNVVALLILTRLISSGDISHIDQKHPSAPHGWPPGNDPQQ
jgi:hypothetical protein